MGMYTGDLSPSLPCRGVPSILCAKKYTQTLLRLDAVILIYIFSRWSVEISMHIIINHAEIKDIICKCEPLMIFCLSTTDYL